MSFSDPVGDLLTRIRNAQKARLSSVQTPASKLRGNVLDVLKREAAKGRKKHEGKKTRLS